MDRRDFLKKSALTGAAVALGSRIPILSSALADSSSDPLTAGCLWGVHCEPRTKDATMYTAIQSLEERVGRRFAVDRQYHEFNDLLPTKYDRWTKNFGRTPYVSWNSYSNGRPVSWARIAQGHHDDWIRRQAVSIKQWGRSIYLAFNHEPENDASRCGTATNYRNAFTHIINVFNNQGASNVTWVATLMAPTFSGHNGGPHNWLPSGYDMIGVDGYNRWPCFWENGRKTFQEIFAPARQFAVNAGKPMCIGEYGTLEATACNNDGDPSAKALWFQNAATVIRSWPEVKWAAYSHVGASFRGRQMLFWVNTSGAALSAFTQIGQTSYFK
jgi:hypothetical protein